MEVLSWWPLTARAAELDVFSRVWGTAHGRCVVVFGPAGVGKTRLAEEFFSRAVRGGVPQGRATASAAAGRVPLGAIAHLLPADVDLTDPVRGFAQAAGALGGPGRARVVMVDDLHWLDGSSAIVLRQLLDAGSIRLIGTVRAGEPVNEAVELLCADDAVCRIDLAPFSLQQVEQVVRAALGGVVGRHTVRRLYDSSGGNALYLRELVSGALAAGALASDGEIWELAEGRMARTPRLVELIGARLRAAGPEGRTVLELLALCEPVPLADAEAVAGMDVLVDLEAAGLIRARTDRGGTDLSLAHPLYAEVIRAGLAPLRRRRLLLDQADRARSDGAARGVDTRRIAAWQLEATGRAEPALLIEAAALARHAHDYVQARDLLLALGEGDHTTSTRVMLGEVLWQLGDAERADAVLAAAASAAADEHEFLAVTMARAANRFWGEGDHRGTFGLFESAGERLADPGCLKSLRHVEGTMRISAGDPRRGLALLDDLAEDVAGSDDPVAWLNAASAIPAGLSHVGRTGEAVAWAERAYRAHRGIADRVLFAHPASQLISGVVALTAAGRLAEARETAEGAITQLTEAHAPAVRVWMIVYLGYLELLAGRVADARRWFAEVAALGRALSRTSAMNLALVGLALSAALLGDIEAAESAAAEASAHPVQPAHGHWNALAAGWLHVAHGHDPQTARSLLSDAAERARISGLLLGEALLLADLARRGGAAQAAARLGEIAEAFDGALVPALARLAAALAADEPTSLLVAAGELAALGADLMAAEAATAASAAYSRSGDARRAAAAAQDARRHLERCGGVERPRTPLLRTAQATASLTERELEIARMAARGTPSREIAETLHVSVRTVQNHLQHAYAKLGVTGRGELIRVLG